jgi:hypothetical protein
MVGTPVTKVARSSVMDSGFFAQEGVAEYVHAIVFEEGVPQVHPVGEPTSLSSVLVLFD